ncbi:MAG: hypothetical protein COT81_05720 [Candidatus Buchananbacteria bacterium CG10_big_fil_rev_8_21_14_0_10_42_9]|uniref:Uncharacterized protein n=1 Tax=Candidatus Buchananbacteria bacterium CG10_big_fil_rev_8_21_14_0_10_42_9 TaxID=1974526 RepID=A0A2H0VZQ9_9BACT|nr:MAG: hypothetical protein COT81_05720 [Candidatus Buchananbacteria bacterium CG10_big_fil_rev_8_21_14_0_10_42_9]
MAEKEAVKGVLASLGRVLEATIGSGIAELAKSEPVKEAVAGVLNPQLEDEIKTFLGQLQVWAESAEGFGLLKTELDHHDLFNRRLEVLSQVEREQFRKIMAGLPEEWRQKAVTFLARIPDEEFSRLSRVLDLSDDTSVKQRVGKVVFAVQEAIRQANSPESIEAAGPADGLERVADDLNAWHEGRRQERQRREADRKAKRDERKAARKAKRARRDRIAESNAAVKLANAQARVAEANERAERARKSKNNKR